MQDPCGEASTGDSAALLRRLLEERGLSQAEFARLAGLSKDHVSRILRGAAPFPGGRRTLLRLARAVGCAPQAFAEYRRLAERAGASARIVLDRLAAQGLDEETFIARVPQYSPGYLRAVLAGRAAFPRDPDALEAIARACGASPFEFEEYLPDARSRERWLALARRTLDAEDFGVFRYLMEKIVTNAEKSRQTEPAREQA